MRIPKSGIFAIALAAALGFVPLVGAQQKGQLPPAPLPTQIVTAKKVFVSNAGADINPISAEYSGGPDRPYVQFYSALKTWARFELVNAPADADLILEIRFTSPVIPSIPPQVAVDPQFRLVILDPKTHVVLWAFTEHLQRPSLRSNRDKRFDQAMDSLIDDLKKLVT